MDIGSILLGVALLLVVAFIITRPLLVGSEGRDRQPGPADDLRAEHERVLTQLRDLDFDHATSKIMDEDYTAARAQLVAQGVTVLKQLDELSAAIVAQPAATGRARTVEDEIEAAVAQRPALVLLGRAGAEDEIEAALARRRPVSAQACGQCGASVTADDRFCPVCGAAQTVTCPKCGRVATAGDQFCGGCGQRLPAPAGGLNQTPVRG